MNKCDLRLEGRGEWLKFVLLVGVAGMCVLGTGQNWTTGRILDRETPVGPEVIHSEQTVGVVTYNGVGGSVDKCRLVMTEGGEAWDKEQLLRELGKYYPVKKVSVRAMVELVDACHAVPTRTGSVALGKGGEKTGPQKIWSILSGIYPGTLWCGRDDIADNYYSLGTEWKLDKCCRAHDHCPLKVKAFTRRYGIMNNSPFTKSYCACDNNFYNCLKAVDSQVTNNIGKIFFNTIGMQCVREKQPLRCIEVEDIGEKEENVENTLGANATWTQERHIEQQERTLKWFAQGFPRGGRQLKKKCLKWKIDKEAKPKLVFVNGNPYK